MESAYSCCVTSLDANITHSSLNFTCYCAHCFFVMVFSLKIVINFSLCLLCSLGMP